nr:uncharacterized protein LOC106687154 [Halyomorpha halys]
MMPRMEDLKAVFDSDPQNEIWNSLKAKNIPIKVLKAIKSTYQEPKGVVCLNGRVSRVFSPGKVVKQGYSLSPLLYIVYKDEISSICKRRTAGMYMSQWNLFSVVVQFLLYADDIVLTVHSPERLQQAVMEWNEELERKGMTINPLKSKILQVGRTQEDIRIVCNKEVTDYTYMAMTINRSRKVDSEVSNRISKANSVYYTICNTVIGKKRGGAGCEALPVQIYLLTDTSLCSRELDPE